SSVTSSFALHRLQLRSTLFPYTTLFRSEAMSSSLAAGQRIEIRGFGSFSLSQRAPRIGRNPKSGERVEVPAKQVPHFKPGKGLRDRKSTRLNSSHVSISYAVFCLKKKII